MPKLAAKNSNSLLLSAAAAAAAVFSVLWLDLRLALVVGLLLSLLAVSAVASMDYSFR
jgi:hypothetical protein